MSSAVTVLKLKNAKLEAQLAAANEATRAMHARITELERQLSGPRQLPMTSASVFVPVTHSSPNAPEPHLQHF